MRTSSTTSCDRARHTAASVSHSDRDSLCGSVRRVYLRPSRDGPSDSGPCPSHSAFSLWPKSSSPVVASCSCTDAHRISCFGPPSRKLERDRFPGSWRHGSSSRYTYRLRRPPTSSLPVTLTDRHSQARLSPIVLSDASGSHNGFLCDTFLRYGRTDFMKYQPLPVYHARRRQLCF